MDSNRTIEYVHGQLNQEVTAIGGHYVFTEETRLQFEDREVLYLSGYAVMDTTCCGHGGCGFALVYGFVKGWKRTKNEAGMPVSSITAIEDDNRKREIRELISRRETISQVNFI